MISDTDTLDVSKERHSRWDHQKIRPGPTMGGPKPHEFPIYALSYRRVLLRSWEVPLSKDFVPADNRWISEANQGELDDEYESYRGRYRGHRQEAGDL